MASEPITVRGYRTVFSFERRLYRFDRWRLPLRGGLPVRALLYAPVVWGAVIAAGRVPALGSLIAALPDPTRYALLPGAITVALLRVQPDGRAAGRALWALLRYRLSSRWTTGSRRCRAPGLAALAVGVLRVCPDWRAGSYRAGSIAGPARVLLRAPAIVNASSSRRLTLRPGTGRAVRVGRAVHLPAGAVLEVSCDRR
jgi:hypothetical protein